MQDIPNSYYIVVIKKYSEQGDVRTYDRFPSDTGTTIYGAFCETDFVHGINFFALGNDLFLFNARSGNPSQEEIYEGIEREHVVRVHLVETIHRKEEQCPALRNRAILFGGDVDLF